jgi:leucyl aminopeptidase
MVRSLPRGLDVVAVGVTDAGTVGVPESVQKAYPRVYGTGVGEMATALGAKSALGTCAVLPAAGDGPRILTVGLGEDKGDLEDLRRAAGAGARRAASLAGEDTLTVAFSFGDESPDAVQAVAEGALLGSYVFEPVSATPPRRGLDELFVLVSDAARKDEYAAAVDAAIAVAHAVVTAREWVNVPPNLLYPESFAEEARASVRSTGIGVEVLDEKALANAGFGGILAVGGGSARPPRLVRYSYTPRGATHHLALVGKGITFDSGGLNLKPADSMYTMKCDMAGAATVLAATQAIARLGLKVKVTTYAALAENLPSDTSYRPSDVLTMYGGTTVENGNSDAEGRLVLADAMGRAGEDKPDVLVDAATLTGACVVALGERTAGVMGNDDDLIGQLLDAAEVAGESFWQLPIPKEVRPKLDSKVADLRSTTGERYGGAVAAAAFLREFVPDGISWVHLDIAGPAFHSGEPYGYVGFGGTGFGVRTLVRLAASLQP